MKSGGQGDVSRERYSSRKQVVEIGWCVWGCVQMYVAIVGVCARAGWVGDASTSNISAVARRTRTGTHPHLPACNAGAHGGCASSFWPTLHMLVLGLVSQHAPQYLTVKPAQTPCPFVNKGDLSNLPGQSSSSLVKASYTGIRNRCIARRSWGQLWGLRGAWEPGLCPWLERPMLHRPQTARPPSTLLNRRWLGGC